MSRKPEEWHLLKHKYEQAFLEDTWPFSHCPKIKDMDDEHIFNTVKMIKDGRAKICYYPVLCKSFKVRFELEMKRRGL